MISDENAPRILFITPHAFNKVTGTGITFTNLFRCWPKSRIATVHDDSIDVTTDVCDTYYRLGANEIRKFGGAIASNRPAQTGADGSVNSTPSVRLSYLRAAKKFLFGDGLPQRGVLTPELESWIEEFHPDVIYTILGSNGLMDIVEQVEQKFNIPLVVHFMDEWMEGAFRSGVLGPLQRRRMLASVRRIVEKSSLRLGICDAMCEAYSERYGVPFQAFQNVVDTEAVKQFATDPTIIGTPLKIICAGSVFAIAQRQSLIDCCQAVDQLAREGLAVQLDIHCPPLHLAGMEDQFAISHAIKLHGPLIDDDHFFSTICSADILLIPANFDQRSIDFIRYSMPTRIPAYMASGTPILVYGPIEIGQVQYAEKSGWGLVVSACDAVALKKAIMRLSKDRDLRDRLSKKALKTASSNHDARMVQQKFKGVISNRTSGSTPNQ